MPGGGRCSGWRARCWVPAGRNTAVTPGDTPGVRIKNVAALMAGVVALVVAFLLGLGPWALVAVPAAVAGSVLKVR